MQYDGTLTISTGLSRKETDWKPKQITWGELCKRLSLTKRTEETEAEFAAMDKPQRGEIKDVGGFVGGELEDGVRKGGKVRSRQLLALDADFGTADMWADYTLMFDWACCMHTTHSHTKDAPRYRMFFPLARPVDAVEYQAIGRRIAQEIDIELFDDTTYQPTRLMYWPSTPKDGEFNVWTLDGPWIDPDEVLRTYTDYRDVSEWPVSSRRTHELHMTANRQENPLRKGGIVGAFCQTYSITQAIHRYLPGIYAPTDNPNRWTYTGGSTVGGLVIYDNDLFAYSHHDTDPCSESLVNAFDLVRRHMFGDMGKDASFEAMRKLMNDDPDVRVKLEEMIRANASEVDFGDGNKKPLDMFDDDYTEQGNAVRLKQTRGELMRWQQGLGWCVWNGTVWVKDDAQSAGYLIMNQADELLLEAKRMMQLAPKGEGKEKTPEQQKAERAFAWAQRCRSYANQRNTLDAAKKLMNVYDVDMFDPDPWLLNTPEGVVDLRTGDMHPHDSKYLCTMMTLVAPYRGGQCPKWKTFLHQVTGGDAEFEDYLQMVAGMACVGKVYEEGLVISYGPGSNGKSTLFAVWQELLGTYAGTVRNEVLMGNKNGSEVQGQAQLRGMRLTITSELEEAQRMSASLLKRLTSRDKISARPLYHEPITFTPSHTLILHTNHLPRIGSSDEGTRRRITIAPFTHVIPPEKKIMDFANVLVREEGPAILGWMIEGAIRFYKADMKLTKPAVVVEATKAYLAGEDKIGRFIEECCVENSRAHQPSGGLFRAYKQWCEEQNIWAGSAPSFSQEMEKRGHPVVKEHKGRFYRSIELLEDCGL